MSARDYLLFALTIAITRAFLASPFGFGSPTVYGFRLHHYMYGAALALVALLPGCGILRGVGLALFVDEIPQLIRTEFRGWPDYWALRNASLAYVSGLAALVYGVWKVWRLA